MVANPSATHKVFGIFARLSTPSNFSQASSLTHNSPKSAPNGAVILRKVSLAPLRSFPNLLTRRAVTDENSRPDLSGNHIAAR
jgi:hypothetical protein